jgi:hypothetical protein
MIEKLKFIMSDAWLFLRPFILVLLSQGGRLLMSAALEAAQAANNRKGATGAQKRDAAFTLIVEKLASSGMEMTAAVVNQAIEAAVLKLKEK